MVDTEIFLRPQHVPWRQHALLHYMIYIHLFLHTQNVPYREHAVSYYMISAVLFLRPQRVLYTEHAFFVLFHRCSTLSSASARTSGNQDVTDSHQLYHTQVDYTLPIVLYARCSTVSSASDQTMSLVIFSKRNSLFGLSAYLTRNHLLICD